MRVIEFLPEGKVKDFVIKKEYDKNYRPDLFRSEKYFGILVSGKLWKKEGKPVSFSSYDKASKAADRITSTKNIVTQVVPLK